MRWPVVLILLIAVASVVVFVRRGRSAADQPKPITKTVVNPPDVSVTPDLPPIKPTSRPTTSTLMIGDKEYKFPAARLVVQQTDPELSLLLFSDEPRATLAKDYAGNRYHLELNLAVPDLNTFTSAEYTQKAPSMAVVESPFGIFIDGDKRQLQPHDIRVLVLKQGEDVTLHLQGQFLSFDPRNDREPPVLTRVDGVLVTRLEKRPK